MRFASRALSCTRQCGNLKRVLGLAVGRMPTPIVTVDCLP